eukprot:1030575-Pyramimonas_sp.AAC.1
MGHQRLLKWHHRRDCRRWQVQPVAEVVNECEKTTQDPDLGRSYRRLRDLGAWFSGQGAHGPA